MPIPSIAVLLPVGAIAFYLCDSTHLLYSNELLITCAGQRWWSTRCSGLYVMGRSICAPGLLLPHRPLFRSYWSATPSAQAADADISLFLQSLRPLQVLVCLLLALLLVALPLVSWRYGAGPHLLVVFAAYYAVLVAALVVVYLRRAALGLSGRAFGGLLFDVIACAPFGVNLVRKLSLRQALTNDPLRFARQHFAPGQARDLLSAISLQVDSELQGETLSVDRKAELGNLAARLKEFAT